MYVFEDHFQGEVIDRGKWRIHGDVVLEDGRAEMRCFDEDSDLGLESVPFFGVGTIVETTFECTVDSEFAVHYGPWRKDGNYLIRFFSENHGCRVRCYSCADYLGKDFDLPWVPNRKNRAKLELTDRGYKFALDCGEGYRDAADITTPHPLRFSHVGFQQFSGTGYLSSIHATGPEAMPRKPDVEIYYRGTYSSFPHSVTIPDGTILVYFRESTAHTPRPGGKALLVKSKDQGVTWTGPVVVSDTPLVGMTTMVVSSLIRMVRSGQVCAPNWKRPIIRAI